MTAEANKGGSMESRRYIGGEKRWTDKKRVMEKKGRQQFPGTIAGLVSKDSESSA